MVHRSSVGCGKQSSVLTNPHVCDPGGRFGGSGLWNAVTRSPPVTQLSRAHEARHVDRIVLHQVGDVPDWPALLVEVDGGVASSYPYRFNGQVGAGGIYGGVFTPTEAAAVVSVYALLLSIFVYRTVGLKGVFKVIVESVVATGFTSFIIGCALLFGYAMAREQIPAAVATFFVHLGITQSKVLVLLSLNVLFLFLGTFLDATASMLIVIPIILPLVHAAHIDPVHFGVVVILNLMIGLSTPPYGEAPIIISRLTNTPLNLVVRETLKFIIFMIIALFIISAIPDTVLWIPHLAGYRG